MDFRDRGAPRYHCGCVTQAVTNAAPPRRRVTGRTAQAATDAAPTAGTASTPGRRVKGNLSYLHWIPLPGCTIEFHIDKADIEREVRLSGWNLFASSVTPESH